MEHISTLFLDRLAELDGPDPEGKRRLDLCQRAGLSPREATQPPQSIPAAGFFDLLEFRAGTEPRGRYTGIELGARMRCDDYGAFGLAFKSAANLFGSFNRVERYGRVVTSVANYTVHPGPKQTFMAIDPGQGSRLGQRMTNELALAAGIALCREVSTTPFSPSAVYFSHERPASLDAYDAHFRCPMHFGADRDGFEIAQDDLLTGNRLGDDGLSRFFDAHLDKALENLVDVSRLDQKVCAEISRALSEGVPVIGDVAARLGMSGRTLQRRLADTGHIYQDLVERTRRSLAERLLRETNYALAEIAFLTGYAEQSTFSRAFKRLSGQTPASFRKAGTAR